MGFPSAATLRKRKQTAEARLRRLQVAYTAFMREWQKIERRETELKKELSAYADKHELKKVIDAINAIKA